jgi:NitT/TauT family transport system substrate-binding protein
MAATRSWARANLKQVNAFRAAIRQAAEFGNATPDELRRILGNMLKLPPQVMAKLELPVLEANITAAQLGWWIDVMRKQDMLKTGVTGQKLLLD